MCYFPCLGGCEVHPAPVQPRVHFANVSEGFKKNYHLRLHYLSTASI